MSEIETSLTKAVYGSIRTFRVRLENTTNKEFVFAKSEILTAMQLCKDGTGSGTVTAGNSSGITDGAAFVLVTHETKILKNPLQEAEVLDYEIVALDPEKMGLGPVPATQTLLKRQNLKFE